ncbi:MAG: hypothetical protein ACP5FH_02120, partial [Terracidiphilus sp.]
MNLNLDLHRKEVRIRGGRWFAMAFLFALGTLFLTAAAPAQIINQTAKSGALILNLKVLPAESFNGPKAMMTRDGGADPIHLNDPVKPN